MTPSKLLEIHASDGLRARDNGEWGKEKLAFLSHFGPVALKATEAKLSRHYVDLFAGPGVNKIRQGREEFDGSTLRAICLSADGQPDLHFTDAWFVNRDRRDDAALRERVRRRVSDGRSRLGEDRIRCIRGDANQELFRILEAIHPRAYVFVFADMEAPKQFAWASAEALRRHRRHESVDLYLLFPLDMALRRLISFNPQTTEESAPALTSFYGTDEWRTLIPLRDLSSATNRADLCRGLLDLYLRRLRSLWRFADVVCDVRRGTHHKLYKMLFASDSDAGRSIAAWASRRAAQQYEMGLGV